MTEPISPQHSGSSFGSSSNKRGSSTGRLRSVDDPNNTDHSKLWRKLVEQLLQINVLRLQLSWGVGEEDAKELEQKEQKAIQDLLHVIEGMSWQGGVIKRVGRVDEGEGRQLSQTHTIMTACCYFGVLEAVKKVLGLNSKLLEEPTEQGWTPLICAADQGWDKVVEYLLEKGADVLMQTDIGDNVLTHVVKSDAKTPVWLNQSQRDLVDKAITDRKEGKMKIFKQLLRSKVYVELVNDSNNFGQTPLMMACQWANDKMVEMMVTSAEVNVNAQDGSGKTALMYAVTAPNKRRQLIRALFQNISLDINLRTVVETEQTAIAYAALQGNVDALEELLAQAGQRNRRLDLWLKRHGKNVHLVDAVDDLGFVRCYRALVKAAANGQLSLQDFNSNNRKVTPLIVACQGGWIEEVTQLVKLPDLDPNDFDATGYTALMHACKYKGEDVRRTMVRTLLSSNRMNLNIVSHEDNWTTALGVAITENNIDAVEELIEYAKTNAEVLDLNICVDGQTQSVLMSAVKNKQLEVVQILVSGLLNGSLHGDDFRHFFNIYPELASDGMYARALALLIEHEGDILFKDVSEAKRYINKSVPLTRSCSRYLQDVIGKVHGEMAFQAASIQGLIRYWWETYGMLSYMIQFMLFALFMIMNILHMALYLEGYTGDEDKGALWCAFVLSFFILGVKVLSVSYYDAIDSWSEWFTKIIEGSVTNRTAMVTELMNYVFDTRFFIFMLDLAIIVLAITIPFLEDGESYEHTLAAQCLLIFFRLLLWLLPLDNVGQQLQAISMVFRKALIYIAMIVIFVTGFSLCFSLLSIDTNDSFQDYSHSFILTALGFFGGVNVELHERYEQSQGFPYNAVFGLMIILYMAVIPTIFIALIVAFLTTSWQDLGRKQNASFWRSRALSLIATMNLLKNLGFLCQTSVFGGCGQKGGRQGQNEGLMKLEVRFVGKGEGDLKSQNMKLVADINHMKDVMDHLKTRNSQAEEREAELTTRIEELMGKLEQLSSFWDGYKMGRKYAELSQSQMS
eukprot:TRINITY_DN5991_c0_g1_i1.p1 TRINITY_DN5991_c0_g1~~TRINITY_DN5991_c0_g1_i1.p1  ORF type:complete len:1021 (-),score=170.53 TRINITY_DN5991_c0_g1_i1:2784-5846(-)